MILGARQINKTINYIIFMAAFFAQAYVDGKYIAYGEEPQNLKVLKYALVAAGIIWGLMQLAGKKRFIFLKELRNILFAIVVFLVVSLLLSLFRNASLGYCIELIARYAMSILYAFVLLNTLEFDDIYRLMTYAMLVSIFGYFLQKGDTIFNIAYYYRISFENSYSPFESSFFAAPSINCCAFFLYYRKNKLLSAVSFLFVLLTFKRPQIVFAIVFLLLPFLVDPNRQVSKMTHRMMCLGAVLATLLWYHMMLPENEWIIEAITGQSTQSFTSGRSTLMRDLLDTGYKASGLGSTDRWVGRGIEMDLVAFMLEMSLPAMAIFVFCFASVSGRRAYAVLVMVYRLFSAMTGSGLYNVMGVLLLYLFFGSVNYLYTDALRKNERSRRKWIRIRFR